MNEKVRNILGAAIIVGVVAFAYAAVSYVGTYSESIEPSSFRSFGVSGEGKVVAVPDIAQFTFSVITDGELSLGDLQRQNTEKVNRAIAFVKSKGVDEKDIATQGYNISPQYETYPCNPVYNPSGDYVSRPCPPPRIVGYTVHQTVQVKVRDFSKVGDALTGVVESGANSVSSLSFTIDDRTAVESKARSEAVAKAKEKAREVARAGGFRVGRLLSIDEGFSPYPRFYDGVGGGGFETAAISKAAPAPSIEPGSQEVTVTVTLRYEIE
jgi:hypothetical protein